MIGEQTRHQPVQVQRALCCKAQPDSWQLQLPPRRAALSVQVYDEGCQSQLQQTRHRVHKGIEYVALQQMASNN